MTTRAEQPFELAGPLPRGMTVLEASAGTGKTFTIAALAARFVAEGLPLERLLVVTFTRIATSELRERVRERLVFTEAQLARVLAGAPPDREDEVVALLAAGSAEVVHERRARLAEALAGFDAATIETTHGFCQRVLDGLGTLGDTDPDVDFVENVDDLVAEVVDDLYVRRFYRRSDGLAISRAQAGAIARIAIENPTAPIHPEPAGGGAGRGGTPGGGTPGGGTPGGGTPGGGTAGGGTADGGLAAMRARLAQAARAELESRKRALALMTHDDQLTRLLDTLTGASGEEAAASLRERYRVVLIDEFQDTDPVQWQIVRRAFGSGETTLVLIGDPKQAIYAFRGADVYAYLQAAQSATQRATLAVNHRSDQALLDGLDALFGHARLGHPGIAYRRVSAAPGGRHPRLHGAPESRALRLRLLGADQLEVERTRTGFASAPSARAFIARDLAADIVRLLSAGPRIEAPGDTPGHERALAPGDIAVLVRSHYQADLIQEQLGEVGVPAVIGGAGSVFATAAAGDWRTLLEALERPAHPGRARGAALTPFIGMRASQLAAATEAELEALHQRLYEWGRVLRERGLAALVRRIFATEHVAARLLSQLDGERHLTDLQHVAELLHGAGTAQQLGITTLGGWLRERIAAADREGTNDERTRRLDSDADAVQVLTFHRGKGLEFPVVYCPFLWDSRRPADGGRPIYFHDPEAGNARAVDVGLDGPDYQRHLQQHNLEERGEELRLAYVALTRARHQAVAWWASSWDAKDSPLGRLLFAQDAEGNVAPQGAGRPREAQVLERLGELAALAPHAIAVEEARLSGLPLVWSSLIGAGRELNVARFQRSLDTFWRRTSYSAITAAAHETLVGSEPEEQGVTDEPAGPRPAGVGAPTADEPAGSPATHSVELPLSAMASGPRLGTLIHRALEAAELDGADPESSLGQWLGEQTEHDPSLLGCTPEVASAGLALALRTPLGGTLGELRLADVRRADRLDELSFELPLAGGDRVSGEARLADVAALLRDRLPADDPLAGYPQRLEDPTLAGVLRGYLTGTIDLVLRTRDAGDRPRFSVIDYKTNWLAPAGEPLSAWHYRPQALAAEMQRSHYALQALLYAVALHRYLRWRLPGYDPASDLAGVHYLFLRGMLGGDGETGVFSWQPPSALIVELSELLDGR